MKLSVDWMVAVHPFLAFAPSKTRAVNLDGEFRKEKPNEHIEAKAVTRKFSERAVEIPIKRFDERRQFFAHARNMSHRFQTFFQSPFGILQFSILFLDLFYAQRALLDCIQQILYVQIVLGEFGFDFAFSLSAQKEGDSLCKRKVEKICARKIARDCSIVKRAIECCQLFSYYGTKGGSAPRGCSSPLRGAFLFIRLGKL